MWIRANLPPMADEVVDLLQTWRGRAMVRSTLQREGEELVLYGLAKQADLDKFRSALSMFLSRKGVLLDRRVGWVVQIDEEEYLLETHDVPRAEPERPGEAVRRLVLAGDVRRVLDRDRYLEPAYERAVTILDFARGAQDRIYQRVLAEMPALPPEGAGAPSILRGEVEDVPSVLTPAEKEVLRAGAREGVRPRLFSIAPPAGF